MAEKGMKVIHKMEQDAREAEYQLIEEIRKAREAADKIRERQQAAEQPPVV